MPNYQHWLYSQEDQVTTLTLNRPQAGNSLTSETLHELREISTRLRQSKEVRAVILEGQGKHFSVGMDRGVIEGLIGQPETACREHLQELQACFDAFEALDKPTIARLHGFCLGGGLILALCCDFRIASGRTIFGMPEVKLGLVVSMGTQRLTRLAGTAATKEIVMLGERFNARTAQAYGLLHKLVPPDELDAAVAALTDKFRRLPPRTVGAAKHVINEGHHLSMRGSQELELDAQMKLLDSPDSHEALQSFVEKRRPRFTGE